MNMMAVDPGKRVTGIFIKTESMSKSFLIDNRNVKPEADIHINIFEDIRKFVLEYEIDLVILEDYPYGMKGGRLLYTAEVKGIIKTAVYSANKSTKIMLMPIATWILYVDKAIISAMELTAKKYREAVKLKHGRDFKTADQCDAYFIMVAVYLIRKGVIKTPASQNVYDQLKEIEHVNDK